MKNFDKQCWVSKRRELFWNKQGKVDQFRLREEATCSLQIGGFGIGESLTLVLCQSRFLGTKSSKIVLILDSC